MAGSLVVVGCGPAVAGRTEVVGCSLAEEGSLAYVGELLTRMRNCEIESIP